MATKKWSAERIQRSIELLEQDLDRMSARVHELENTSPDALLAAANYCIKDNPNLLRRINNDVYYKDFSVDLKRVEATFKVLRDVQDFVKATQELPNLVVGLQNAVIELFAARTNALHRFSEEMDRRREEE